MKKGPRLLAVKSVEMRSSLSGMLGSVRYLLDRRSGPGRCARD